MSHDERQGATPCGSRSPVFLSHPTERDADEFIALVRQSEVLYRGLASPPATRERFDRYLDRCRAPTFVGFLIRRISDGGMVGSASISEIVRGNFRSGYLGYHVFAPCAGRGYMTAGLALVLDHAFGRLRLHRLEANIQPHNAASLALVVRLGFRREGFSPRYLKLGGRWRDHEHWAILAEEWRRRRP